MIWTDTPNIHRARSGLRQTLRRKYLTWIFKRMKHVMGTGTPAVKALVAMGAPALSVANFPCWIDERRYWPKEKKITGYSRQQRPICFFSTGLLDLKVKGHDVALNAFSRLQSLGLTHWEYHVAGVGPDADKLAELAERLGIDEKITWFGWLEPAQLIVHLQRADVFIHPSPSHEPYGVAVLEAMAAGLPILASDYTCAALDRVEHGIEGYIHSAGDSIELAEHIESLLIDESLRGRMGSASREKALDWPLKRAVHEIKTLIGQPVTNL